MQSFVKFLFLGFWVAKGFSLPARRRLLAALAMAGPLWAALSIARAADLVVDQANGNSPYTLSASTLATSMTTAGNSTVGVFNHVGGVHTAAVLSIRNAAGSHGSYSLANGGTLSANYKSIGSDGTWSLTQDEAPMTSALISS